MQSIFLTGLALLLSLTSTSFAQENGELGRMWTFENPPLAYLEGRDAAFDNEYPFNLPKVWLDRKDTIDMTKSVNFVSTNDISIGNSGSVVVNTELEVVGVVGDGNIESLHNDFVFTGDVARAISTHVDGIMEALVKIYEAHHVVRELTGK